MRVLSIVGARPQFVKAAAMCRAIAAHPDISHKIIHTGQHYDARMSDVFFEELGIPVPDHHLGVGSGTHAVQTGEMMKRLEPVLAAERPDWVLLYGDTNSTLAGVLVAAKLNMTAAHIEAGLRSFNRRMPEEINRIVADRLSALLFCPTPAAIDNLKQEGLAALSVFTGDVMYDAFVIFRGIAEQRGGELASKWRKGEFALATIHRAENTDDPATLAGTLGCPGNDCRIDLPCGAAPSSANEESAGRLRLATARHSPSRRRSPISRCFCSKGARGSFSRIPAACRRKRISRSALRDASRRNGMGRNARERMQRAGRRRHGPDCSTLRGMHPGGAMDGRLWRRQRRRKDGPTRSVHPRDGVAGQAASCVPDIRAGRHRASHGLNHQRIRRSIHSYHRRAERAKGSRRASQSQCCR